MLDVGCEALADRRVADLAEAIGVIDVTITRIEDRQESRDLAVDETEDRVGHELVSRTPAP